MSELFRFPTADEFADGVLAGNRAMLARAITLVESHAPQHHELAQEVMRRIMPHAGNSVRLGISGVPGVGKSTFIESWGCQLCAKGKKVAVLAIDPSSTVHGGSIMGDKTRMEHLSNEEHAFVRPSPSGGSLGGVARKTRESMFLCEAAGFDVIIVETVGVGQSEVAVRSMVDFFLLLMLPGAGDELQGIKRGIVELADAIAVTKCDGDNQIRANLAKQDYMNAIHYIDSPTPGWRPTVLTCSSKTKDGLDTIWNTIERFVEQMKESKYFFKRRNLQMVDWVGTMIEDQLVRQFYKDERIIKLWKELEPQVIEGQVPAPLATEKMLKTFFQK